MQPVLIVTCDTGLASTGYVLQRADSSTNLSSTYWQGSQTSDSKSKSEEKAGTSNKIAKAELGKAKDLLDDVFDSARIKGKSGAPKKVPPASKTAGLLFVS